MSHTSLCSHSFHKQSKEQSFCLTYWVFQKTSLAHFIFILLNTGHYHDLYIIEGREMFPLSPLLFECLSKKITKLPNSKCFKARVFLKENDFPGITIARISKYRKSHYPQIYMYHHKSSKVHPSGMRANQCSEYQSCPQSVSFAFLN